MKKAGMLKRRSGVHRKNTPMKLLSKPDIVGSKCNSARMLE